MSKTIEKITVNYPEFKRILEASTVTIHDLAPFFKREQMDFDEHGNVFVGFSEETAGLPILVAHTDNVLGANKIPVFDLNRRLIKGTNNGIGFDDKAGIIAIITLWRYFKDQKFRIIFPADEEVGGIGSSNMETDWYSDAKWILELDRRGSKDFIQTSGMTRLCSDQFAEKFLEKGFKKETGTFTDVNNFKQLAPWINMANISIGYYEPHTDREYLDTVEFENIINKVAEFIVETENFDFDDDVPDQKPDYDDYTDYDSYKSYDNTQYFTNTHRCTNCGADCRDSLIYNKYHERFCSKDCMDAYDEEWQEEAKK